MKLEFRKLGALCGSFLIALLPGLQAQAAKSSQSYPFRYDASEETTVSGSVTAVLTKGTKGMMNGSHLLMATPAGSLDVSLGAYGLIGKDALAVRLGEQIEVVGVMKTLNNRPVFMARTVTAGDQVYPLRSAHGIAMSPQARERAGTSGLTAPNGGTR